MNDRWSAANKKTQKKKVMMFPPHGTNLYLNIWMFPKNRGTPKWMVYFMENPIKMDALGGFYTPIFSSTPISQQSIPGQMTIIPKPKSEGHLGEIP